MTPRPTWASAAPQRAVSSTKERLSTDTSVHRTTARDTSSVLRGGQGGTTVVRVERTMSLSALATVSKMSRDGE